MVEDGAFSQRCVLVRPGHRGGRVTALAVLPGLELVLAVQQDLDSVVGEGSFERYRCNHESLDGVDPAFDSIPFSYSPRCAVAPCCQDRIGQLCCALWSGIFIVGFTPRIRVS